MNYGERGGLGVGQRKKQFGLAREHKPKGREEWKGRRKEWWKECDGRKKGSRGEWVGGSKLESCVCECDVFFVSWVLDLLWLLNIVALGWVDGWSWRIHL